MEDTAAPAADHQAAVLRGPRHRRSRLRVELSTPAAGHPARRGGRQPAGRRRPVPPRQSHRTAVAARTGAFRSPARDPADRRDRPRRRAFRSLLLELLAGRSITIPAIGTIRATVPPVAVLTSNRTRDLHDALKRRCLYHWIDHPDVARVVAIVGRADLAPAGPARAGRLRRWVDPGVGAEIPGGSRGRTGVGTGPGRRWLSAQMIGPDAPAASQGDLGSPATAFAAAAAARPISRRQPRHSRRNSVRRASRCRPSGWCGGRRPSR